MKTIDKTTGLLAVAALALVIGTTSALAQEIQFSPEPLFSMKSSFTHQLPQIQDRLFVNEPARNHQSWLVAATDDPKSTSKAAAAGGGKDPAATGTDPRNFAPKFMPYMRHTELENGLEQNEFTLFGLFAFSPKFAMTYEIPLGMERDVSDTALRNPATGLCGGALPGGGAVLPNGLPAEGDCEETGIGDMNLRFMYRLKPKWGADWLVALQLDFPTASEDVLGSETMVVGPAIIHVHDLKKWPAPGAFAAFMHFYKFDAFKDSDRGDVSMYVGRYFFMLPISKKHKLYLLPEIQFVSDFENDDHTSLWFGPELGKILAPGRLIYVKPGFGIDPDEKQGDRDWTLEIGFRYFM